MACLTEDAVVRFVQHRLASVERESAEQHLDECRGCLRAVAETAKLTFGLADDPTAPEVSGPVPPRRFKLGRYVLIEPIGAGGMGVVYAAHDPQLDRKIALKLLREEEGVRPDGSSERLLREARAMAQLSHPNVVTVHDTGTFEDQAFVAMELVEGWTLDGWLRAAPRASDDILEIYLQAGRGLSAAHAVGLIHRDFKPSNVLVGQDGRVRVTDFGLARSVRAVQAGDAAGPAQSSPQSSSSLGGTPAYMAPEQFRGGPPDPRTDQFSFCLSLAESLRGGRPPRTEHGTVLEDARRSLPWLEEILARGLASDPERRYPSMDALLQAMTEGRRAARAPKQPRLPLRWVLAGGATAASLVLGVWLAFGRHPVPSTPSPRAPAAAVEPAAPPAAAPAPVPVEGPPTPERKRAAPVRSAKRGARPPASAQAAAPALAPAPLRSAEFAPLDPWKRGPP